MPVQRVPGNPYPAGSDRAVVYDITYDTLAKLGALPGQVITCPSCGQLQYALAAHSYGCCGYCGTEYHAGSMLS